MDSARKELELSKAVIQHKNDGELMVWLSGVLDVLHAAKHWHEQTAPAQVGHIISAEARLHEAIEQLERPYRSMAFRYGEVE